MESKHVDWSGASHFTLGVEIETDDLSVEGSDEPHH